MSIHTAFDWLIAKGYTEEVAKKIAGKVYWEQKGKSKGKKKS